MRLVRIVAPHFVAGIELTNDWVVIAAAPIVKYMVGWRGKSVMQYCATKGWEARSVAT